MSPWRNAASPRASSIAICAAESGSLAGWPGGGGVERCAVGAGGATGRLAGPARATVAPAEPAPERPAIAAAAAGAPAMAGGVIAEGIGVAPGMARFFVVGGVGAIAAAGGARGRAAFARSDPRAAEMVGALVTAPGVMATRRGS